MTKAKATTPAKTRSAKTSTPTSAPVEQVTSTSTQVAALPTAETVTASLPDKPLVFMHIPKTGGHTLRAILSTVYGDALCPAQNWAELAKVDVSQHKVFIGHFGYEQARETFGDADFATFLREPRERLLSLYHYLQRTGQIDADASLDDYLTRIAPGRGEVNQVHQYLSGKDELPATSMGRLFDFAFVGSFEIFDVEIVRLAEVLNWSGVPPIPVLNTADDERQSLPDLKSAQGELLYEANKHDLAIYQYARANLWKLYA